MVCFLFQTRMGLQLQKYIICCFVVLYTVKNDVSCQPTTNTCSDKDKDTDDSDVNYSEIISNLKQITTQMEAIADALKKTGNQCKICNYGKSSASPGESCQKILTKHEEHCQFSCDEEKLESGLFWIANSDGTPTQVWCDMKFQGGGWLQVYNAMRSGLTGTKFGQAIKRNSDLSLVLPNSTSTSIASQNIPLYQYHKVVFGWARSADAPIDHYGIYLTEVREGLQEICYIGRGCSSSVTVGDLYMVPPRYTFTITTSQTSNVQKGLVRTGGQVVWGYDDAAASNGIHWGNWMCPGANFGACNDRDMLDADNARTWRYVILIK